MEGANANEIHRRMADVYDDSSPKYSTVAKWSAESKCGRNSLEDDPRPGRPADVISQEIIERVESLCKTIDRLKLLNLLQNVVFLMEVFTLKIIHKYLGMSKESSRWVPRNLNMQDYQQRVKSIQELLEVYKCQYRRLLHSSCNGDEPWLQHWVLDTIKESMQ